MAEIRQSGAQISDRAKQVAAAAEATSTASAAGLASVQNTTATMESIREQAEAVAENIIALSEKNAGNQRNHCQRERHRGAIAPAGAERGHPGRGGGRTWTQLFRGRERDEESGRAIEAGHRAGALDSGRHSTLDHELGDAHRRSGEARGIGTACRRTWRTGPSVNSPDNIEESVRAFQQIVGGSSQQQIGFEQVTEAFRNIGIASQETATGTKQSEQAVANLAVLSQQLRKAMERYRSLKPYDPPLCLRSFRPSRGNISNAFEPSRIRSHPCPGSAPRRAGRNPAPRSHVEGREPRGRPGNDGAARAPAWRRFSGDAGDSRSSA